MKMQTNHRMLLAALGLSMAGMPNMEIANEAEPEIFFPRGKAKPKQGKNKTLRGYYARYTHTLSEYIAERNRAKLANNETGFKGFRNVRKFIPETGMSIWVKQV